MAFNLFALDFDAIVFAFSVIPDSLRIWMKGRSNFWFYIFASYRNSVKFVSENASIICAPDVFTISVFLLRPFRYVNYRSDGSIKRKIYNITINTCDM